MELNFTKYQGAGNDFIIINALEQEKLPGISQSQISNLCDRHFGVGADGLMILEESTSSDFKMVYYNSDGKEGSLCGNGSRCAVHFYYSFIGKKKTNISFSSFDGIHHASVVGTNTVKLGMSSVKEFLSDESYYFMDTGSPHIVIFSDSISELDMEKIGQQFRNVSPLKEAGTNVNLVQKGDSYNLIRTFERGVEGETLACGTGVTAAALIKAVDGEYPAGSYKENFQAIGGLLCVYFDRSAQGFENIYLEGPAEEVFKGQIQV